ncbi:MAG TPA: hypothetical protein VGR00_14245, partial [Thermoanaerobaculia bacterium]|nr:hypothetical protein [Thermoanaerobaculia bacterium]
MNRRRARRVVAAFFLGFLGFLALSYRPPRTAVTALKEEIAPTLLREAPGVRDTARFREFEYVETRPSESTYRLRALEAIGFEAQGEQIFRLKDAIFESKEPGTGRTLVLSAPRAEFISLSKAVKVFEGVRIEGEGTTLHGDSFRYDPALRLFISDGPVSAVRDELVAHANEGRLATRDGVVDLGGAVRVRGRLEGGRTVDLTAPRVRLGRSGQLRAEGDVVVKSDDGILRCKTFERSPTESGDELKAEGDALLVVPPRPPQPDAPFLARGETITLARDEKADAAVLVLTGAAGKDARVDLAPSPGGGARRATSASFTLRLEAGALREMTSPAAFDSAEEGSARGKDGALRTLTAGFGRFLFAKETRTLDIAT